jgi:hypothetical protein
LLKGDITTLPLQLVKNLWQLSTLCRKLENQMLQEISMTTQATHPQLLATEKERLLEVILITEEVDAI